MSKLRPVPCRSCGAAVFWVVTASGKMMPVDSVPVDDGNIVFVDEKPIVLKAGQEPSPELRRYKSHFATCKHAAKHRRKI